MKRYIVKLSLLSLLGLLLAIPSSASPIRVYSLNLSGASVSVIDTETNQVVHTITGIPWPRGSAFSPDGRFIYVCSEEEHNLYVVDTTTYAITNKVHLNGHPSGSLVITRDGNHLLVPKNPYYGLAIDHHDAPDTAGIDVVDLRSLKVIKSIPMKEAVHDLFISPDGKYVIAGSAKGQASEAYGLAVWDLVGVLFQISENCE